MMTQFRLSFYFLDHFLPSTPSTCVCFGDVFRMNDLMGFITMQNHHLVIFSQPPENFGFQKGIESFEGVQLQAHLPLIWTVGNRWEAEETCGCNTPGGEFGNIQALPTREGFFARKITKMGWSHHLLGGWVPMTIQSLLSMVIISLQLLGQCGTPSKWPNSMAYK